MRLALIVLLVAACDLQPPRARPGTGSGSPAPVVAAAPVTPADAGRVPDAIVIPLGDAGAAIDAAPRAEITEDCVKVATHIAEVVIGGASDPTQKAALEQDRTKLVRRAGDACTRDAWPEATRRCFLTAATVAALDTCTSELAR